MRGGVKLGRPKKTSGPFPHRVTSGGGRRVSAAMRKGNRRSAGHVARLLNASTEPVEDTVGEASADDFWLVGEGVRYLPRC